MDANPNDPSAYNVRGTAYGRAGRLREALADFDRAIQLDPRFYQAYANRALVHRRMDNFGPAINDYTAALQIKPDYDTALAVKSGADVIVLDGMQGGTAATQEVFIEHVGLPILAAIRPAVQALQDLDMHRKVQLIVSGGIRNGADVAKALALGADAVSIGTAALIALGDNAPHLDEDYQKIGSRAGAYDDYHEGRDPAGITTQDPELMKRFDPVAGGRRLANYLSVLTLETQTIARACGKSHVHNLEPEDLVALTVESAAMAQVPLAGTNWIPGANGPSGE